MRSATGCMLGGRKAWSEEDPVRTRLPMWRMTAGMRKSSNCSMSLNPMTLRAS